MARPVHRELEDDTVRRTVPCGAACLRQCPTRAGLQVRIFGIAFVRD